MSITSFLPAAYIEEKLLSVTTQTFYTATSLQQQTMQYSNCITWCM